MADEEKSITVQTAPALPTPDGVIAGTAAHRRAQLSPEDIRRAAEAESSLLTQVAGFDGASGYKEAVSLGDSPTAIFARTEIKDENQAKMMAVQYALQIPRLRHDPVWKDEPWIGMSSVAAAMFLYAVFMKSVDRQSLKEATMGLVGMLAPDVWPEGFQQRRGGRR